jgi:F0F1-type ATP synthase assembly protein I
MSEDRRRDEAPGEAEPTNSDDLADRFPDAEQDERLRPVELPEAPRVTFERPKTRAAQGEREEEGTEVVRFGKAGSLSGKDLRSAGIASTIGWGLVASIAGGALLGHLVDRYLLGNPATPWGLIVGFLLGVVSGFVNLIRVANRLNRDE